MLRRTGAIFVGCCNYVAYAPVFAAKFSVEGRVTSAVGPPPSNARDLREMRRAVEVAHFLLFHKPRLNLKIRLIVLVAELALRRPVDA